MKGHINKKELKKLTRIELLEMLVEQSREVDRLKSELEKAKQELNNKKIAIENSGSIAEAALALTGVFEKAQEAVDLYVANIEYKGNKANEGENKD